MAADTVAGYIQGLLHGVQFKRTTYALDREARRTAMNLLFDSATQPTVAQINRFAA